jgi:short-subunit dehydrogenase
MHYKTALVTGASRGIGLAITQALVQQGLSVCMASKNEEKLIAAKNEIIKKVPNAQLHHFASDLSKETNCENLVQFALHILGSIDVLINNAGFFVSDTMLNTNASNLQNQLSTNLLSAFYVTKNILPNMQQHGKGYIFNMSSIAGQQPYSQAFSYSISKYALQGFSQNLRQELMKHNIKVTTICPGAVLTDSWAGYQGPPERLMPPEDVAHIIISLLQLSPSTVVEEITLRPQLGDL